MNNYHTKPFMLILLAVALLSFIMIGCADTGANKKPTASGSPAADLRASQEVKGQEADEINRSLFERLGGEKVITAIVDDMAERVIADPRVNFARKNVETGWFDEKYEPWKPTHKNIKRFKKQMVAFLSLATGGPVEYTGRDMKTVHENMKITNNEFDAMVGDIKASMDRLGIAAQEKRELLAIVETTRKQIVEVP